MNKRNLIHPQCDFSLIKYQIEIKPTTSVPKSTTFTFQNAVELVQIDVFLACSPYIPFPYIIISFKLPIEMINEITFINA